MKIKFLIITIFFTVLHCNKLFSQDLIAPLISNNPKALFENPALAPTQDNFFSLPIVGSFNTKFSNSFSFSDVTENTDGRNYRLNSSELLRVLSKNNNRTTVNYSLDIFHLGFALTENNYLSFAFRNRFNGAGNIPAGLAELTLDNPIDSYKTFDISSDFKFMMWNEIGVQYSHKVNENWQIGGRFKCLFGMFNIETDKLSYTVEKLADGSDYYYLLSGDLNMRSSNYYGGNIHFNSFLINNPGIGVDLGAKFQTVNKRLTVNASVTDVGFIFWNTNSKTTVTNNPNNKLRFDGFGDLEKTFNSGSFDLENLFDSVGTDFKETIGLSSTDKNYFSALPTTFQTGGIFSLDDDLSHYLNLGFAGTIMTSEKFHYAISAGYSWISQNQNWQLLANYTYYGNSANGLGLGAVFNAEVYQIYLATNNILSVFSPLGSKLVGLNCGVNFFRLF